MSSSRKRAAIAKAQAETERLQQQIHLLNFHYNTMKTLAEELARRLDVVNKQQPVAYLNSFGEPQKEKDEDFNRPVIEKPMFT